MSFERYQTPLPEEAAEFYRENGFLVVEGAFSPKEVEALNDETVTICRGERGDFKGILPVEQGETDDDVIRRYLCIHFPHKISPAMTEQISHPSIVDALTKVIGPNVKCMQSMLFVKASGKPGQAWHQDEVYIPTRDRSLTGVWLAMDDATVENGCLWVIPGSQKRGVLWPMKFHEDVRFDCAHESYNTPYSDDDAVPVEVKAGTIVVFNGYLLHRSLPNKAKSGFRRALVNHYMSAESLLPWFWPEKPTGMAMHDHRDIVLVAGEDPYAYKGTEDLATPHVRPDGEGGCVDGVRKPRYSEND
ncbi:MAG TPA: phytanoyl-CoA dioxygenase family protein [Fimbriimonadaceae bacterium]|nr:phytanoyl-CoA dioxygenase family protein [Fimbriimonadaceae bacterium]